jgi:hypothetical protein
MVRPALLFSKDLSAFVDVFGPTLSARPNTPPPNDNDLELRKWPLASKLRGWPSPFERLLEALDEEDLPPKEAFSRAPRDFGPLPPRPWGPVFIPAARSKTSMSKPLSRAFPRQRNPKKPT